MLPRGKREKIRIIMDPRTSYTLRNIVMVEF